MSITRPIPQAAIDIIKKFEGLRFAAYPDPATGDKPYTVGWGHTGGVFKDTHIDINMAEKLLRIDLESCMKCVLERVTVPLSDNELSALLCFVFNLGPTAFINSTLLRLINENRKQEAADQFLRWDKAAGKVLAGLTARRKAERELFLS